MKMLNLALFGPPGAGKGTQSKKLMEKFKLDYVSTGDMLREEIKNGTEIGREAKDLIEKGKLAPDELIVKIIKQKIQKNHSSQGFLFDGFPRTVVQAYILEGLLFRFNSNLACMVGLDVPEKELVERLLKRAKIENRSDDTEEVIQQRLLEYKNKTKPVADFYSEKGKYFQIDGTGDVDNIFSRISETIDSTVKDSWNNIVIFGPPGAGKGRIARDMAEKFNMVLVATGEMMRDEIERGSKVGKIAQDHMNRGEHVPDEIPIRLIEQKIKSNPNVNGFFFNGFPRTIVQAYILDGLLQRMDSTISCMIHITMPTLKSIRRLKARGTTEEKRIYDTDLDVILKRMEQYVEKTIHVKEYYIEQEKYHQLDGDRPVAEVHEEISQLIEMSRKLKRY